ncbi:MAG: FtsX-like permease family protein, partial [Paraclostridium sordellii]
MITIDHTLPIWMKALVSIISIFSFIYYRYLILYIIEEKLKDYGVLISLGCNKDKIKYKVYKLLAKYTCITLIIGLIIGSILYYGVLALINGTNLEKVSSHLSIIGYVIVIIIY